MSVSERKTNQNHEVWNDEMARKHNPDDFINNTAFPIRWMEAYRIKKSIQALNSNNEMVVLDLGCGAGNMTERLVGKEVVGIDLSDTLIDMARKRCANKSNIQIKKGAAEHIEYPDSYFDRLICSEVLEHVEDPVAVINEMHRVMKPGGVVVITVPNEELINGTKKIVLGLGLKKIIAGKYNMSDNMLDEWHVSEITEEWVETHCTKNFKLLAHKSIPFSIFPYHNAFTLSVLK